jgi:uncharacterized protein YjbI with pentapeptide repeats
VVGYDGGQNVRYEEHQVEHKTQPGWKPWIPPKKRDRWERWGLRGKTVWDWLNLLVVPVMLAVVVGLFTTLQIIYQSAAESQRQEAIADQNAQFQRFIEEFRVQESSLQAYLDLMTTLLLEHQLRESNVGSDVRAIARVQTLSTLRKQDAEGKGTVVSFLYDAGLIQRSGTEPGEGAIVDLATADLINVDLSLEDLGDADLGEANLRGADLKTAILRDANLRGADLRNADLRFADLSSADLCCNAALSNADLSSVILRNADLGGAYLNNANLSNADLSHADLSDADLTGAKGVTYMDLQLMSVKLENTIMPDGTKHD